MSARGSALASMAPAPRTTAGWTVIQSGARERLVIFGDDFGKHPSSAQHLARQLVGEFDIDWVNTIGSRRPSWSRRDLVRASTKMLTWLRGGSQSGTLRGLRVHDPWMWPGFGSSAVRAVNRCLLRQGLRDVLLEGRRPLAVVTTHPLVADLARATPQLNWIYYCVDAYDAWPGLDHASLRAMERTLLATGCKVIASSPVLIQRLMRRGVAARELTHGVDLEHWRGCVDQPGERRRGRPRALFFGGIDARLDRRICLALADTMDLVLTGPVIELDPALRAHPHIHVTGPRSYARLPDAVARADVLVMPYSDQPATRAMQPLKLKEYLATGKPVVATPLPALRKWSDALDLASDPARFAALARGRAGRPLEQGQSRARRRLAGESWGAKARRFVALVRSAEPLRVLNVRICRGPGAGPERLILPATKLARGSRYSELVAYLRDPLDAEFVSVVDEAQRLGTAMHLIDDRARVDRRAVRELSDLCRRERISIWHAHDYKSNLIGLLLRRRLGLRLVTTVHGWVHHTRWTPLYYAIDRFCLRRYDRVIAVSRDLERQCLELGVARRRLARVETAVDLGRAPAAPREVRSGRLVIAGVGRLEPEKGFDLLVDAVERLIDSGIDVELRIAGAGSGRSALSSRIARSRHADRLHLCGHRTEIDGFLREADLFALPSRREGLPIALLEAMAHGLPIVAARAGGVGDAIEHGRSGLLCAVDDLDGLTAALARAATDAGLRRRLGAAAQRLVRTRYSLADRTARVHSVYDELLI